MSDPIRNAAEEIRRRIEERVAEIKGLPGMTEILKLHRNLNGLQDLLSEPKTGLAELFGLASEGQPSTRVKFDEFYGVAPLDAAKRYLRKMDDARPLDEIVEAIRSGGGKVDNEEELKMGLSRSTLDIVKIGERYGALEKYPHIKRGGGRRRRTGQEAGKDDLGNEAEENGTSTNGEASST